MRILKNPSLAKAADFFMPLPGETPCLGIALGRDRLSAVETLEEGGKIRVRTSESFPLPLRLWEGTPPPETAPALASVLAPLLADKKGPYRTLQVSLPDPAALWEVFELEAVPAAGAATEEFLNWRFRPAPSEAPALAFATQALGEEKGKKLLLGVGLDLAWIQTLRQALEASGGRPSVLDLASRFRFNLFHETFRSQGPGALVSLERDYWTLSIWDGRTRPRYQRSKWWKEPVQEFPDLPLEETLLEVERTIRSYVHSGPDRSVDRLFLLAPEAWREKAAEAFRRATEGRADGLAFGGMFEFAGLDDPGLSPSAAATAVRR